MVLQFLYEHYGRKFHEIPFSIWQLYKTEFDFIEWFTCITDYSFILFILISLISHLVRFNRRSQEQKTLLNALCSDVQKFSRAKTTKQQQQFKQIHRHSFCSFAMISTQSAFIWRDFSEPICLVCTHTHKKRKQERARKVPQLVSLRLSFIEYIEIYQKRSSSGGN